MCDHKTEDLPLWMTIFSTAIPILMQFFTFSYFKVYYIALKANTTRGYKTFFMLNSAEHEILNAYKYKTIKKFSFFQAQITLECYFSCS